MQTGIYMKMRSRAKHLQYLFKRHRMSRSAYRDPSGWLLSMYSDVTSLMKRFPWPLKHQSIIVFSPTDTSPFQLRMGTSDWTTFEEILYRGEYDLLNGGTQRQDVRLVVDLGANIGITCRLWKRLCPNCRIVGVEPDPDNFQQAMLNAGQIATLIEAGIGGHPRAAYLSTAGGQDSFRIENVNPHSRKSVDLKQIRVVTMDQLLEEAGVTTAVDLLKVDIEGAEAEVFASCSNWIGRVRQLVVEIHSPYSLTFLLADLRRCGSSLELRAKIDKGDQQLAYLVDASLYMPNGTQQDTAA